MIANKTDVDGAKQMFDLLITARSLPLIYVVTKLGIPDLLKDEEKDVTALAKDCKVLEEPLYRVLRALSAFGVFEEKDRKFRLTTMGQALRGDAPKSLKGLAIMVGCPYFWRPWGELLSAVEDGATPFEKCFGSDFFSYLGKSPDANQIFNQAMTSSSNQTNDAVAKAYDFSKFSSCVDIGGGNGALAKSILNHYPTLRISVFEADAVTKEPNLPPEIQSVTGDFFKSIPEEFDAYLMQKIIHDWDDREAGQILHRCREAIKKSGKLLIIDSVLKENGNSFIALMKDIEMLVMTKGGKERTELQFKNLLKASRFELTRVIETGTSLSIIEAVPV